MYFQAVNQDGDKNDGPVDDLLHVRLNAGEVHAVIDDGDNKSADERAEDSPLATGQTGAAHDHCRDDFQLHEITEFGVAGDVERRLHDATETGQQTSQSVDKHQHPLDRHTGKPSGLRVPANGVNVTADRGSGHGHMRDGEKDQHQDYAVGQSENIPAASQPAEGLVSHRHRSGVGKNEGQSLGDEHDSKRGDKCWDTKECHQTTGEQSGESAGENAGHGPKPQVSIGGGVTAQ